MKDYNLALTTSYFNKLSGVQNSFGEEVPVFYGEAPDDFEGNFYIVINSLGSNPGGTKNSEDTTARMQITVHTRLVKYNNGVECDYIVDKVLRKLPRKMFDNGYDYTNGIQDVNMKFSDDQVFKLDFQGAKKMVNRSLIFEHILFFIPDNTTENPGSDSNFHINGLMFLLNGQPFNINA